MLTSAIRHNLKRSSILFSLGLCVSAVFLAASVAAQTIAPGGPGKDAHWETAGKQGIGTSANLESKVWFTLAQGVMTEVYYPNVTVANVQTLQVIVVNTKTGTVQTERDDMISETLATESMLDTKDRTFSVNSLSFVQTNKSKFGDFLIRKKYTTDPKTNSVSIDLDVEFLTPESFRDASYYSFYVYYDPSLANTGMHDTAWTENGLLLAQDGKIASALASKTIDFETPKSNDAIQKGFAETSNGFLGINDGLTDLRKNKKLTDRYSRAVNGNVVQTAILTTPKTLYKNHAVFHLVLGFGETPAEAVAAANKSMNKGFSNCQLEYEDGWAQYIRTIPKVDPKYQAQFNMAAMVLKAQEDKTVRGANVASLTVPWGGGASANEDVGGGYHLIWSRDLYHVFTAYLAIGDKAAAERALDFLFKIQQKEDGSFPQNSWLDGKRGWGSLQMDEVGYPLIMAWQLARFDKETYEKHVKRAADFLVKNGPATPQERWEERPGYSPSTIAAEIAGLVCAADIAKRNGDAASAAKYLATADHWQANIEKWTATTRGKYGDGNYYIRISEKGEPDGGHKIELNNNAGTFLETDIVDAGFLELVRLGIKPADDPLIIKSLKVIDQLIKVDTPNGPGFYRYSHDGYGEMDDGRRWNWDGKYTGKGRLWALLSGERGQYELAYCGTQSAVLMVKGRVQRTEYGDSNCPGNFEGRIDAMLAFANEGLMIPEQVWDKKETPSADRQYVPELKFGEGTGSATPLAWSMAQFIRLATNLKAGRNLDTPRIVYDRYVLGKRN